MEQSQLVELIRALKPEEKAHVVAFSKLLFFNSSRIKERVISLLELCVQHDWSLEGQAFEKNEVFERVFPGHSFLGGKLEKVMVDAQKVVRAFLLTQQYFHEGKAFHQLLDFSELLRKRGLESRYRQTIAKIEKLQTSLLYQNGQYYHQKYLLEYAKVDEASIRNPFKGDLNLHQALDALELDYLHKKLELLNQLELQKKMTIIETPEEKRHLLGPLSIPENYLECHPTLRINYEINQLLGKENLQPSDVQRLYDLLLTHEKHLDPISLRDFYSNLRNICILTLTADFERVEIDIMLQKLYRDNLERGYMHYEGKLHRTRFWAISSNATRTKDFAWAFEFIERYKHDIRDDNESQDIYRLNLANYYFAIGRYSDCLDNLPPTFPYTDYLLHGKRLELKALYEMRSDLLPYKMNAFKMFLSRTSPKLLPPPQRQTNIDFSNLLTQIANSIPGDQKRFSTLNKRMFKKRDVVEWRWLLEKVNELRERAATR